jgi:hypothetical protein
MDHPTIYASHGGSVDPLMQITVEFTSSSSTWVAQLDAGTGDVTAIKRIPATDSFVVIVSGHAYFAEASNLRIASGGFSEIVRSAISVSDPSLVIVEGDTEIGAYDAGGLSWKTGRLSWDGLRLGTPRHGELKGEGWDAPSDTWIAFSVDLVTGRTQGGTRPPNEPADRRAADPPNGQKGGPM